MHPILNVLVPLQGSGGGSEGLWLLVAATMAVNIVGIAGIWLTFRKAGEPGWAAIVPLYNIYIMIQVSDNEWWWVLLVLVPVVGIFALLKIFIDLAHNFGRGVLFGLGLWLFSPIFFPILGFGGAEYSGRRRSPPERDYHN